MIRRPALTLVPPDDAPEPTLEERVAQRYAALKPETQAALLELHRAWSELGRNLEPRDRPALRLIADDS